MNDFVLLQKDKPFQNLQTVISNFVSGETNEACCFEMLKEISVQKFEDEALMLAEIALIKHPYKVVFVVWILLHDVTKILSFLVSKLMVHLCVPGNLERQNWPVLLLMVSDLDNLCK